MIYFLTVRIIIFILYVFFGFKVYGKENIPRKGAFLLASNHTSHFDPPILAAGFHMKRLQFMAKEELFYGRFFGWYIRRLGAYPLRREKTDVGAIRESIRRIRKGLPIVVFPEGGRSTDGAIREGLPGIALLASKERIPIVPAFISGAVDVLKKGSRRVYFSRITLRIGTPLVFKDHERGSYEAMTQQVMEAIKELSSVAP